MLMGLIGWVVVGALVGFIVSKMVNLRGDDPRFGIAASAVGAIVGGVLYTMISGVAVAAWNPWSIGAAAVGAVVGVVAWHAVRSRSISRDAYTTRRSY